ncbi:MAG: hypothetical protein IJ593_10705, partial [Lachnospiraceae bacterium]|nr:hypothetical protein [Lachnospiraceae bacterium]
NTANAQNNQGSSQQDYNNEYINKLTGSNNLTDVDLPGVDAVTDGAKQIAGWIVQVLSYVIIAFLAVRTLIDLAYITIPFTRTFLANGYTGQPQSSTQTPMAGSMNNGMMGGPMGGGMYGNRYGGGMYGNSGGMYGNTGMYGNAGMTNQMLGQNSMMNRNSSMLGNVQFVTNAALNAVATESTVGSDGKTQNAFKIYAKDMMVTLIIVPILVLLAATGVVTQLGFAIGGFLVDAVRGISGKIGNM